MSTRRVSIITPSYQQAAYLQECIDSVHGQSVPAEHIVVDGGSTDGSSAIIARNASKLSWSCSEKGKARRSTRDLRMRPGTSSPGSTATMHCCPVPWKE